MIYLRNGKELVAQFKTEDGTTYPSNWLMFSTPEEREALGIITLTVILPPLEEGEVYDMTYIDNYENLTRTFNKTII